MSTWQHNLPPLAGLVAFEAAFRHQNFTRAAEELHFSQATVSRRVSELEADLGVNLFTRRRHDAVPTPDAEKLAVSVRLAFNELAASAQAIRHQPAGSGALTIYSDLSLTSVLVAPLLGDFQRGHPDLDIRVLSSWDPIEQTTETFDIGLQYSRNAATSLVVQPIADDEVFPVCSPTLAADVDDPQDLAQLLTIPLLHVDYGEPAWVDWHMFIDQAATNTPTVPDGLVFTSYQACLDVAEAGEGLALGWGHTVKPRLEAGRLVRVSDFVLDVPDAISAYRHPKSSLDPVVDELISRFRSALTTSD